jgi:hypothetical protein
MVYFLTDPDTVLSAEIVSSERVPVRLTPMKGGPRKNRLLDLVFGPFWFIIPSELVKTYVE